MKIQHVPYTGSPQVVTDLLANRIHGYFSPASTVMGHVAAGKLVALGTTDAKRTTILPDLPTMIEAGVPDCVSVLWFGLVAPAGTPQPVIDRLSKAANEALKVATTWRSRCNRRASRGSAARRRTSAATSPKRTSAGPRSSPTPA